MKKILISIKPKWVAKILNGEKTIEVRKTAPKCELPCEVYIYCTKENSKYFIDNKIYNAMMNGKVVAKFTLNKVHEINKDLVGDEEYEGYKERCYESREIKEDELLKLSCLDYLDLRFYLDPHDYPKRGKVGYAWHIDHLVPFDRPKELKEFHYPCKHKELSCEECVKLRVEGKLKDKPYCHYGTNIEHAPQSYMFCEVDE